MNNNNNKGYTLIEMIAAFSILGIIIGLALPLVRNVQDANTKRKLNTYKNSLIASAKLYVDSYGDDIFGSNDSGCHVISYEDLADTKLIKDINIEGVSCNSDGTKIGITKKGGAYSYNVVLGCGEKTDKEKVTNVTMYYPKNSSINEETCKLEEVISPQTIPADQYDNIPDDKICSTNVSTLYNVFEKEAKCSNVASKYTGTHQDSFNGGGTKDIYYWNYNHGQAYDRVPNLINVIFGGFCWQMVRTTDTGGVKMFYNGVPSNGQCTNSGSSQLIGQTPFNSTSELSKIDVGVPANGGYSIAQIGYMYNPDTLAVQINYWLESGSVFGADVVYENGKYRLIDQVPALDNYHHYSCNNTTGICDKVRYYSEGESGPSFPTVLTHGENMTQAINNMTIADNVNKKNSAVKEMIDNWFKENLYSYRNYLEETVFCTERGIKKIGGYEPNGGSHKLYDDNNYILEFKDDQPWYNIDNPESLTCTNVADKFSTANSKAKLDYSIGLATPAELSLGDAGYFFRTGTKYWLSSAADYPGYNIRTNVASEYGGVTTAFGDWNNGVRPMISIRPGVAILSGSGSKTNPFIIS